MTEEKRTSNKHISGLYARPLWRWIAVTSVVSAILLLLIAAILIRRAEPILKSRVIETLSTRFGSKVELDGLQVSITHGLSAEGRGLRIFPPDDVGGRGRSTRPARSIFALGYSTINPTPGASKSQEHELGHGLGRRLDLGQRGIECLVVASPIPVRTVAKWIEVAQFHIIRLWLSATVEPGRRRIVVFGPPLYAFGSVGLYGTSSPGLLRTRRAAGTGTPRFRLVLDACHPVPHTERLCRVRT